MNPSQNQNPRPQITEEIAEKQPLHPIIRAQLEAIRSNYRLTPATLAPVIAPDWIPDAYLLKISSILAQKIAQGNARILLSVPPRHGKSKLVTEIGGTWYLENNPTKRLVIGSYGAALSTDFSRKIRDHFITNEKLLTKVRDDVANVNQWETTAGGGCTAVGVGGALTGKGADLLLIDDYLKDIAEANNPNVLESIWEWYQTVAYTRLHPNASVVVVATRWATDDLIGRLALLGGYEIIEFPAIALEDDILGRKPGEALSSRFPIENLEDKKRTLGSFFFSALYQQKPIPKDQLKVERSWFKITTEITELHLQQRGLPSCRVWDLAATEGGGDYTAGGKAYYDRQTNIFYIADMQHKQYSSKKVAKLTKEIAKIDGLTTPIYIEQEPGASGKTLIDNFKTEILPLFNVNAVSPTGSKTVRAQPLIAAAEDGRVELIRGPWNSKFLDEIQDFPRGKHDDQVDVVAHAYNILVNNAVRSTTWGRNTETTQTSSNNRKGRLTW